MDLTINEMITPPLQTKRFFAPLRCTQNDNVFRCKGVVDIGSFAGNINHAPKMRECRSFRAIARNLFLNSRKYCFKTNILIIASWPKTKIPKPKTL